MAKIFCKFLCGAATMADGIFGFGTHLGKGKAVCFKGSEDRVIAESAFTHWL